MKITKTASGNDKISISKREWEDIGKTAGWFDGQGAFESPSVGRPVYNWMGDWKPANGAKASNIPQNCPKCGAGVNELFWQPQDYGELVGKQTIYNTNAIQHLWHCSKCRNQWETNEARMQEVAKTSLKLTKTASGKKLTMSRKGWEDIGKKAGWVKVAALQISYTGLIPSDSIKENGQIVPSQTLLGLTDIPEGWTPHANHMTINLGQAKDPSIVGQTLSASISAIGKNDMVIAVKVDAGINTSNTPHITLAVNPQGGKPSMSNEITEWTPISPVNISGVIQQVKSDGFILTQQDFDQENARQAQEQQEKEQAAANKKQQKELEMQKIRETYQTGGIEGVQQMYPNLPEQAIQGKLKGAGINV